MLFKSNDGGLTFALKKGEGAPNLVSYDINVADGVKLDVSGTWIMIPMAHYKLVAFKSMVAVSVLTLLMK